MSTAADLCALDARDVPASVSPSAGACFGLASVFLVDLSPPAKVMLLPFTSVSFCLTPFVVTAAGLPTSYGFSVITFVDIFEVPPLSSSDPS